MKPNSKVLIKCLTNINHVFGYKWVENITFWKDQNPGPEQEVDQLDHQPMVGIANLKERHWICCQILDCFRHHKYRCWNPDKPRCRDVANWWNF